MFSLMAPAPSDGNDLAIDRDSHGVGEIRRSNGSVAVVNHDFWSPQTWGDWEHLARVVEIPLEMIRRGKLTQAEILAAARAWYDRQRIQAQLLAEAQLKVGLKHNGTVIESSSQAPDDVIPPKRLAHRPWPGSADWHNWGVGVDQRGQWHLFHFQRWGDARSVYRWVRHRHARVPIARGQMDELARAFIPRGTVPIHDADDLAHRKPIVSRLRDVIRTSVRGEGHKPRGSPIQRPTTAIRAWQAAVKLGIVRRRERHFEFRVGY